MSEFLTGSVILPKTDMVSEMWTYKLVHAHTDVKACPHACRHLLAQTRQGCDRKTMVKKYKLQFFFVKEVGLAGVVSEF